MKKKNKEEEHDLYRGIPHVKYDGDITSDFMASNDVHELADKLLQKGFAELKKCLDSKMYKGIHRDGIDEDTGHNYPERARMNPPEDALGDVEVWVYDETGDDNSVEPHFHVCKGQTKERGVNSYEIDIEVKIRNITQLDIWQSVSGHTSWKGLEKLYYVVRKWLNEKAYDADITNKEVIRQEWNRNNMSNRVAKTEL